MTRPGRLLVPLLAALVVTAPPALTVGPVLAMTLLFPAAALTATCTTPTGTDPTGPADATAPPTARTAGPRAVTVPGADGAGQLTLTGERLTNSAVIIDEGHRHDIPAYGWVIALATALQESGLRNLPGGDRDSGGLFQQRPSQGWGTRPQIGDPHLATRAFYGVATHTTNPGLTDIPGWQQMTVTAAAQVVQISAYPDAYARWQTTARAIVAQLDGTPVTTDPDPGTAGSIAPTGACTGPGVTTDPEACPATGSPAETGLTPDALLVLRCGQAAFPTITEMGGVHPDPLPDHPSGRAVDLMIPGYDTAAGNTLGWRLARWMRTHHTALGVRYVIFDQHIWNTERDDEGWRPYTPGYTATRDDSSLHRNHVHVTVYGDQATGPAGADWVMFLPAGRYRIGCAITCYPGHTGQDFPAATGTPLTAPTAGTVVRSEAIDRNHDGHLDSYGNLVVLRPTDSPRLQLYFAHLDSRAVTPGQQVTAGQLLGHTGNTGRSEGPHLHVETRLDGHVTDPMPILRSHGLDP